MQQKILLTGATGFLGSHILKKLLNDGKDVVILTRESSNLSRIKALKGFAVFELNQQLSNIDVLFESHSINTIIHVATEYGRNAPYSEVIFGNVYLPIKLIEIASKKKLILFINTDSFFSKFQGYSYLKEYIITKKIFKEYLKSLTEIQIINLQLEHIYGENDSKDKFIPFIIDKLKSNVSEIALTDGSQKRDFIYVDDVVNAYMIVLKNKDKLNQYSEFEVGTGVSIPLKEFVKKVHHITNSKSNLLFGKLPNKMDEIKESHARNIDLKSIGWVSKYDITSALKKILLEEVI